MNAPLRETKATQKLMYVDCDIHPIQRSPADLYPWLTKRWRDHYETFGPHIRAGMTGAQVHPRMMAAGQRADVMRKELADAREGAHECLVVRHGLVDLVVGGWWWLRVTER